MYTIIVITLLFVLPIVFAGAEILLQHNTAWAEMLFRWFVFWGVGIRLLTAGISQIPRPRYTAEKILVLQSGDAQFVVRELGPQYGAWCVGLLKPRCAELGHACGGGGSLFYGFCRG